ncbi:DUF5615 family PIN-like protein [Halovivax cerinus]|uniref:DUF5615 family PIN-like protein n=1 Tax=Halovivax cerinus TaxID=1487865 RepID=A0ABD5NJQ1_9EURY|nr:DUF5615 family PIN-like protein [Halovivax cerinus]
MRPLYCDEGIWIPVADGLSRRGWTVHTVRGEGKLGEPDRDHLSYARQNDWILVTFDDDFLSLVETNELAHAGIIYVQQAGRDIGSVVKSIDGRLETLSPDDRGIHYC